MARKFHDYSKEEYITVQQYLHLKTGAYHVGTLAANISPREAELFGVTVKKGWFNKNKDKQIPIDIARKAAKSHLNSKKIGSYCRKLLLESLFHGEQAKHDDQYVYLLVNENYHCKIGISKDPLGRAKGIQNTSGYHIREIYYWSVKDSAKRIESFLHKTFKDDSYIGEWFSTLISPEEIESYMPCEYKRMF